MMLTKKKNSTHKQRTLPNDECLFRGSNVHETDINGCQEMDFVAHTQAYAALVWLGLLICLLVCLFLIYLISAIFYTDLNTVYLWGIIE